MSKKTYLGYIKQDNGYYNFYPQYTVEAKGLKPVEENFFPAEFWNCITIKKGTQNSVPSNNYWFAHDELDRYEDKICFVTFSHEDLHVAKKTKNPKNQKKSKNPKSVSQPFQFQYELWGGNLIKNGWISVFESGDRGIYLVTKAVTPIDDVWYKNPTDIVPECELDNGKPYFLEVGENIIGPFICKGKVLLAKPDKDFVNIDNKSFYEIESKTSTGISITERYVMYNPEAVDNINENHVNEDNGISVETGEDIPENNAEEYSVTDLIDSITEEIHNYRSYDKNMIKNMLICITQGFLTVFAGEPGTGKTSICDKIADILGVSQKDESDNRYLSISVERGWTSKNDLIGYYNPLTKEITDVTGLHKAVETVSGEEGNENEETLPYFVLLDEANLSQMEYYWSNFIKLADDDARKNTPLVLNGTDKYRIPDWFKFLATINNDQTTESLSPRLLDRAWVITLPAIDDIQSEPQNNGGQARISWKNLKRAFGKLNINDYPDNDKENLEGIYEAENRLSAIYEIYKKGDKPVSPRSKKAISAYIKAAVLIFGGSEEDKITDAIDFVFLQRLLPMLNGYISEEFKNVLKTELKKYPLSEKKFEKMCSQEDDSENSYVNFFM